MPLGAFPRTGAGLAEGDGLWALSGAWRLLGLVGVDYRLGELPNMGGGLLGIVHSRRR